MCRNFPFDIVKILVLVHHFSNKKIGMVLDIKKIRCILLNELLLIHRHKLIHSTIQRSKLLSNTKKIFDFENKRNKGITEA